MNFNSIEKNNELNKKPISVIDCFSDESTLFSKHYEERLNVDDRKN